MCFAIMISGSRDPGIPGSHLLEGSGYQYYYLCISGYICSPRNQTVQSYVLYLGRRTRALLLRKCCSFLFFLSVLLTRYTHHVSVHHCIACIHCILVACIDSGHQLHTSEGRSLILYMITTICINQIVCRLSQSQHITNVASRRIGYIKI